MLRPNQSNQFRSQWVETKLRTDKTVRHEITRVWAEEELELHETKRVVTPWGVARGEGVVLFAESLRKVEIVEAAGKHLPVVD